MQMPSIDEYNNVIDELLKSLKYIKFSDLIKNIILKILEPIERFFKRLFERSGSINASAESARLVLVIIVALVFAALIGLIIFGFIRRKRKKRVKSILGEKIHKDSTVTEFLDRSKKYEDEGAYRQAIRLRFIAVLFYLHQNHFLYHDSSMTGKEMVERLKNNEFIASDSFQSLTYQFNTAWYGMDHSNFEVFNKWSETENVFWQEVQI